MVNFFFHTLGNLKEGRLQPNVHVLHPVVDARDMRALKTEIKVENGHQFCVFPLHKLLFILFVPTHLDGNHGRVQLGVVKVDKVHEVGVCAVLRQNDPVRPVEQPQIP